MFRKTKSLSLIGILLVLMMNSVSAQAKAWRGIVPLKSTRADVERLLGLPGKHGRYQFEKERAYISYARKGPCHPANECLCFVNEDIVISIYVELEVEMRFSGLNLDKKKYKKFISPQDPTLATYSNDQKGIIYTVDEEDDDVIAIEYVPTAKDCQDVIRRAKRAKEFTLTPQKPRSNKFSQNPSLFFGLLLTSITCAGEDSENVLLLETRESLRQLQ